MNLPFTHEQFLELFREYNLALAPYLVSLWLLTAISVVYLFRRGSGASRFLSAVLALHWGWSGIAYHLLYFQRINPAALLFTILFVVQALLFLWLGVIRSRLGFQPFGSFQGRAGLGLILYSFLYPLLGSLFGLDYPRLPLFGVPCPTTILTIGALLMLPRREARIISIVPLVWAIIGGSAAILLEVYADLALCVGFLFLVIHLFLPARASAPPGLLQLKGKGTGGGAASRTYMQRRESI